MSDTTTSLEQDIEFLKELDGFRVESAKWRNQGRAALVASLQEPSSDEQPKVTWEQPKVTWEQPTISEYGLLLKALSYPELDPELAANLVDELGSLPHNDVLGSMPENIFLVQQSEDLPLLSRARAVSALASARNGAFSPSMMYFYYAVVRELYYADAPDWCIGGARAAPGGHVSAYATSVHVRAVLSFARCMERTADFIDGLAEIARPPAPPFLAAWERQDFQRQSLSFYLTMASRSWNLAIDVAQSVGKSCIAQPWSQRCNNVREAIHAALVKVNDVFTTAQAKIKTFREEEESAAFIDAPVDDAAKSRRKKQVERSVHAHALAAAAVDDAVRMSSKALQIVETEAEPMHRLALLFREAAERVRKVAEPAVNYLSSVLDHELTNATGGEGVGAFSACDLAFAATSVGAARGWEDGRLPRAGEILSNAVAETGELGSARPYHVTSDGSWYQPPPVEAITAYAQLLEQVPKIPIDTRVLQRFANFFKRTRNDVGTDKTPMATWRNQYMDRMSDQSYRFTAAAVIALDRINRMLDARINQRVLAHFSHRRPLLTLNQLFYGDYGLCEMAVPGQQALRTDSVAIVLQRMRAHVRRVPLPPEHTPCFSIVLHGPPGSGKTTMIEALARTCDVELVEVTPSDIVVGGQDAVERRARAVFAALSLLTRVVILFDEFDPVLRSRDVNDGSTPTVFSFLTPGLLPKLKELHDLAEKRSVAYALITNLVGSLDAAAIRSGRFDLTLGVYPPDLLSRFGQLWTQFHGADRTLDEKTARSFCDAITFTAGVPMQELTRKGWFVAKDAPRGSIFSYFNGGERPQWPEPQIAPAQVQGFGRAAERENREWTQLSAWERRTDDRAHSSGPWLAAIHDALADPAALARADARPVPPPQPPPPGPDVLPIAATPSVDASSAATTAVVAATVPRVAPATARTKPQSRRRRPPSP
jgi:hypothetical protein